MKKPSTLLILMSLWSFTFYSCVSGKEYHAKVTFKDPSPAASPVYLRAVRLEPAHSLRDYESLLPDVVTAMLTARGITLTKDENEATLSLEVFLQRKEYQKGYEQYESITLSLTLFEEEEPLIFLFHTEDLASSIDSVPLLCSILDKNLALLSKAIISHNAKRKRGR